MTMLNDRNEPRAGEPFGTCRTCSKVLKTQQESDEHRRETLEASDEKRSHSVMVTNPPRGHRVQRQVDQIVSNAVDRAMEELYRAVDRGDLSDQEAQTALRQYPDFADAFEVDEDEGDEEYVDLDKCIQNRTHLISCDDDGYCNCCGEQEGEPSTPLPGPDDVPLFEIGPAVEKKS